MDTKTLIQQQFYKLKEYERVTNLFIKQKFTKKLRDLRHYTLLVHEDIEHHLDHEITNSVYKTATHKKVLGLADIWFSVYFDLVLQPLSFSEKIKLAVKLGSITPYEGKLFEQINTLRNHFSHKADYKHANKLEEYNTNNVLYLKTLEKLMEAVTLASTAYAVLENRKRQEAEAIK